MSLEALSRRHQLGVLLALAVLPLLISASWIMGKQLLEFGHSPYFLISFRTLLAGLLMMAFIAPRRWQTLNRRWYLEQSLLTFIGRVAYSLLALYALFSISASESVMVMTAMPVFTIVGEAILARRWPTLLTTCLATLASFAVIGTLGVASHTYENSGLKVGHLYILLAACSFVLFLILYKHFTKDSSPLQPLTFQFLLTGLIFLPFCLPEMRNLTDFSGSKWLELSIYAIPCNLLPFVLSHYLLKHGCALWITSISILTPLIAILLESWALNTSMSLTYLLLSALSLAAVAGTIYSTTLATAKEK